ncbi:tyrosine recombinase XerC [Candidatus Arthromitus sp. SFB-rat-Yit]|uniref:tyrosine recombinase XerC n=1 Tax=Candidatus Arthromitus sp. SFB-rat-Yit TaxID=1041504 RepID=UPI000227A7F3|nr:tyrosine recombinase XerC [Candidatus Arthromitus sp. SFB-rat-Yit]BAK81192.1 site-specific tyrosine recombinase XerC [Candidatus Arthromitus sp. SFB-rat-Yit]
MENKECSIIISDFLDYLSGIKGASEKTIKEYRIDLIGFFNFIIKKRMNLKIRHQEMDLETLKKVSISDMYAYVRYIDKERLNAHNARARKISSLRTFYTYLTDKIKVIDKNIASELETPKIPKRNPIYLDLEESKKVLSTLEPDKKFYTRDYCIISMFLNCALRLSELVSINIEDIDWVNNSLSIIGKGNKERIIYLNEMVLNSIKNYLKDRNKYRIKESFKNALFISSVGQRISNRAVEEMVKKHVKNSSIDKKITPHKLRHTSATLMFKYGKVDIRTLQKVLGHENISTTQIYTHVDDEGIKNAFNSNPLNL